MFIRHSPQDDSRDKARREEKRLKDFYGKENKDKFDATAEDKDDPELKEVKDNIIREMLIDQGDYVPNKEQRTWLAAQAVLVEQNS